MNYNCYCYYVLSAFSKVQLSSLNVCYTKFVIQSVNALKFHVSAPHSRTRQNFFVITVRNSEIFLFLAYSRVYLHAIQQTNKIR